MALDNDIVNEIFWAFKCRRNMLNLKEHLNIKNCVYFDKIMF